MKKILDKINGNIKQCFFNKVIIADNGCHLWGGATYGKVRYGVLYINYKRYAAHRVAWVINNNKEIPKGMFICHKCDVPLCVNPEHLFLGTQRDNLKDMANKGRQISGSAKLAEKDIAVIYNLYDLGDNYEEIGDQFNVNRKTIWKLITGRQWKKQFKQYKRESPSAYLTQEQVYTIYKLKDTNIRNIDIARQLEISDKIISNIVLGKLYKKFYINYYGGKI